MVSSIQVCTWWSKLPVSTLYPSTNLNVFIFCDFIDLFLFTPHRPKHNHSIPAGTINNCAFQLYLPHRLSCLLSLPFLSSFVFSVLLSMVLMAHCDYHGLEMMGPFFLSPKTLPALLSISSISSFISDVHISHVMLLYCHKTKVYNALHDEQIKFPTFLMHL